MSQNPYGHPPAQQQQQQQYPAPAAQYPQQHPVGGAPYYHAPPVQQNVPAPPGHPYGYGPAPAPQPAYYYAPGPATSTINSNNNTNTNSRNANPYGYGMPPAQHAPPPPPSYYYQAPPSSAPYYGASQAPTTALPVAAPSSQSHGGGGGVPAQDARPANQTQDMATLTANADPLEKFPESSRPWNDVLAAVLWLASVAVVLYLSSAGVRSSSTKDGSGSSHSEFRAANQKKIIEILLVGGVLLGSALAIAWYRLMHRQAQDVIRFCMICMIVLVFVNALFAFMVGQIVLGIILLLFAGLAVLFFMYAKKRIAFTAALMVQSMDISTQYKATIVSAFVGLAVQIAWAILVFFGVLATIQEKNFGVIVVFVFFYFWTQQVIKNVVHVAVVHTVSCWYFLRSHMPANPTAKGVQLALTKALGSISFGSAIVAAFETLRWLLRVAQDSGACGRNQILFFVVDCIVGCIEGLVNFFNEYAFVQCVIYGKSFIRSAKDTWELFKTSGMNAVSVNNLSRVTVTISALLVGLICAIACGLYAYYETDLKGDYWVVALLAFILGYTIMMMVGTVIDSAVAAIFVCWAEEPECLAQTNPEFHDVLTRALRGDFEQGHKPQGTTGTAQQI